MISMSEYSILIEDNSRIFLVKKISFDKKKRKLIIFKYKQDNSYEVPAKDIVLDEIKLEDKKVDKLEIQFSHEDFWSFLIKKYNILSIEDFIISAIDYYDIKNYDHLNIFLESFNSDFTYYKVVDKDKVYLNPKDIVSKILNNLDIKKQKTNLSKDFIRALNDNHNSDNVDWAKYNEQITQIINYLAGEKKYSRTFIESVKYALGANNYFEILSLLKSFGVFNKNFEPLYSLLNLDNDFPYSDSQIKDNASKDLESKSFLEAFTIDDEETYDFDDAFSIKREGDVYLLSVHITNFSSFFLDNSIFTEKAKEIINTIYVPSGNFDLYSKKMIESISLVSGKLRPVLSINFKIENFEIISHEIEESIIKVKENYTYSRFQSLIPDNLNYEFLDSFTEILNNKRLKNADFKFFNQEINIKLNNKNNIIINELPQINSRRIVSELMILANFYFSKFFIENSVPAIFRSQKKSDNLEISIIDDNPPFCFHRKVSPVEISSQVEKHSGLGLDSYLQITSPVRRYLDSINMRQISFFLQKNEILFTKDDLDKYLSIVLPKLSSVKDKSKKVYKLWALKYLSQENHNEISGYIYAKLKDKYIIFFNKFNFFDSVDRVNCKNSYEKDDFIQLYFDDIDYQNLQLINLKD